MFSNQHYLRDLQGPDSGGPGKSASNHRFYYVERSVGSMPWADSRTSYYYRDTDSMAPVCLGSIVMAPQESGPWDSIFRLWKVLSTWYILGHSHRRIRQPGGFVFWAIIVPQRLKFRLMWPRSWTFVASVDDWVRNDLVLALWLMVN